MILITGANGQLGTELQKLLDIRRIDYVATDVAEMDITDLEAVRQKMTSVQPDFIFHTAAFTAVDAAEESKNQELVKKINIIGTKNIAQVAEEIGATVIYLSTDYVFNGQIKSNGYLTNDPLEPINFYGKSKALGEKEIQENLTKYYIIRTSWVFGQYGKNFVFTMQKLAESHPQLRVVNDQLGRPTWTKTLAEFMIYLVENTTKIAYGIYHLSNEGEIITWYDFAKEILKDQKVEIIPVTSTEFIQRATRPKYSGFNLEKTIATGFKIPTWNEALQQFLQGVLVE